MAALVLARYKLFTIYFRAMFTCCHVLEDHKPILYISHDEDGDRQFLYGGNHREEDARILSFKWFVHKVT